MTELVQTLKDWGCDTDGALPRFLYDEDFMLECIVQVSQDENFALLKEALEKGDGKSAFEAAHALKGITANTGLTPLYTVAAQLTELLRAGATDGALPLYDALLEKQQALAALLS